MNRSQRLQEINLALVNGFIDTAYLDSTSVIVEMLKSRLTSIQKIGNNK